MKYGIEVDLAAIDQARIARLWTWSEVSRRAGVSLSTISLMRSTGYCMPTTLEKVRTALGMSRERATA